MFAPSAANLRAIALPIPRAAPVTMAVFPSNELEYEEIARVLDSKVDTLKVNYHYAKEKIKEYILNR